MTRRTSARTANEKQAGEFVYNSDEQAHSELRIKRIEALNDAQAHYMKKINGTVITFGIGPAGTGKTWIASVMAAQALKQGRCNRVVVTRPAIEAGEKLGFLPGELNEKYDPYFRPVRDAFEEALGKGPTEYYIKSGKIEARPLAYLRGSTLKDSWIIFDEAQNSTPTQMKMLLTRIGENAKLIINGDLRQVDIPGKSGLLDGLEKLAGLPDVAIVQFSRDHIVRSGVVRDIIDRYEGTEESTDAEGLHRFLNK